MDEKTKVDLTTDPIPEWASGNVQDEVEPPRQPTFNDHGAAMLKIIEERKREARKQAWPLPVHESTGALGDLALAQRHLEDALTRYNSARYRMMATWHRNDPDRAA